MTRFLGLLAVILFGPTLAQAGERVALVVGVGQYENTAPLANPERDATAVAAALEEAGFEVSLHLNVTQREFGGAMFAFQRALDGAEAAVFYFAGHGIQIDGSNYLLSADAVVDNPLLVDQDGIELSRIVEFIESRAKTSIAIIDACRDNPLANALIADAGLAGRSAGAGRGLAPITREFANSMVVFATAPGAIAYDGTDENSPFTEALLRHINTPDVEVLVMLKRVTNDVLEETDGAQRPEVIASMAREFYFIHNEINAAGDVVVINPSSDEGAAANLLTVAQQMPAGASREAGLALVVERFPETAAAAMARQLLDSSRVAVVAAPPQAPAPEAAEQATGPFDRSLLGALDVDAAREAAAAQRAAAMTPEDREAALGLEEADVIRIQTTLNAMGYDLGTADGAFGPKSREALRLFQLRARVPQTGFLDTATIEALLAAFDAAPKTYDGTWRLTISREWLHDDSAGFAKAGERQVISSLTLEARDGRFAIRDFQIPTVEPDDPFADFRATYDDTGRVRISGRVSTHFKDPNHQVAKLVELSTELQLPQIMPVRNSIETQANRIDGSLRFHVALARQN